MHAQYGYTGAGIGVAVIDSGITPRNGVHHDQVLWGIVAEDWRLQRLPQQAPSIVH